MIVILKLDEQKSTSVAQNGYESALSEGIAKKRTSEAAGLRRRMCVQAEVCRPVRKRQSHWFHVELRSVAAVPLVFGSTRQHDSPNGPTLLL
jgi:hypothetical protein